MVQSVSSIPAFQPFADQVQKSLVVNPLPQHFQKSVMVNPIEKAFIL
jgi:hypothetical protein